MYTTLAIQTARMQPAILSQTRQDVRLAADLNNLEGHVYDIDMNPPDYEAERVFFLNAPTEVVRHTRVPLRSIIVMLHRQDVLSIIDAPPTLRPMHHKEMNKLRRIRCFVT